MEGEYLNIEYIYYKIYHFIFEGFGLSMNPEDLYWFKFAVVILSALLFLGIIYNLLRLFKIRRKQLVEFAKSIIEDVPETRSTQWDRIKKLLDSSNPSDWRWAILEADGLLEDIIKKIGYKGETFGERLSQIRPSQFKSLGEVWTAHKVRNRIAHADEMELTKSDVEKVLGYYEKALKELEYI